MLCHKYGGAEMASRAARVIQHAYRRYRLRRSFARIRLEVAATAAASPARRLSRGGGLAGVDAAAAGGETTSVVGGVRCRVRATTDSGGRHVDALRWTGAERRRVVAVTDVSVTSTTARQEHRQRVVVRGARCCAAPGDTSSVASSSDYGPARPSTAAAPRAPAAVDGTRSDDDLLRSTSDLLGSASVSAVPWSVVVSEMDEPTATDTDDRAEVSTFRQLCLTDSSYGEMNAAEAEADADSDLDLDDADPLPPRPHYVDGDALDVDPSATGGR